MPFVLDSSVALAVALPDERSETAQRIAEKWVDEQAIIPTLWHWEVANGLRAAHRRKHLLADDIPRLLQDLRLFPTASDTLPAFETAANAAKTAVLHSLTVYDAAYLDLAIRRRLPLATLDDDLKRAAKKAKVKLF
jgi:predicted nucleic acid-binding protein